jgi:hypothetical protein
MSVAPPKARERAAADARSRPIPGMSSRLRRRTRLRKRLLSSTQVKLSFTQICLDQPFGGFNAQSLAGAPI